MRISKLVLTNFRSFTDQVFDFTQPRTLLLGPNGAGKSTVIDAIALALLGECRGTDARGAGARDLIQLGASKATIRLTVDGIGRGPLTITRDIVREGSGATSHKPSDITGALGVTAPMLKALIYGRTFFDLSHTDGKDLLLRLLDVTVMGSDLPGCGFDDTDRLDIGTLDRKYQEAYNERPALKRALAAIQVPDIPKVAPMAVAIDIKEKRAEARAAVERLSVLSERRANIEDQIRRIQGRVVNVDEVTGRIKQLQDLLDEAAKRLVEAQSALAAHDATNPGVDVQALMGEQARHQALILKIQTHDPARGCVLNGAIPCYTEAAAFAGEISNLQAKVDDLKGKLVAMQTWTTTRIGLSAVVTSANRDLQLYQGQLDKATESLKTQERDTADLVKLKADLAGLPDQIAECRSERDALDLIVDQADAQQREVAAYEFAVKDHRQRQELKAKAQEVLDACEARVQVLGPKGAKTAALQRAVGDFQAMINAALRGFGFTVDFQVEPWDILIRTTERTDAPARSFSLLSKGEQLWTATAFQLALAAATGVDCCLVDDLEAVVNHTQRPARSILTGMVMKAPVGQVVLAMAKSDTEPIPDLNGLQTIWVGQPATVAA